MTALSSEEAWTADDRTFGARLALIRQRKGWGNVKEAALAHKKGTASPPEGDEAVSRLQPR